MKEQTVALLACPLCHHHLQYDKHYLICQHDRCYFPIVDHIPVLLPESASAFENEVEIIALEVESNEI